MFTNDLDVYEEMVYDELTQKSNFNVQPPQNIMLPKEEQIEEKLVVGEEIVVSASEQLLTEANCQQTEAAMYFGEGFEGCNKIEYDGSNTTIPLTENSIVENWDGEEVSVPSFKESELDNGYEEIGSEEETIATFDTAAGQQLALYAVEDSDEIFAVTVYDESGEPPTNFEFLMRADVERLIGEGAVRTVKKPSQMKKRLLTQPSIFLPKDGFESIIEQVQTNVNKETESTCDMINTGNLISQQKEDNYRTEYNYNITSQQSCDDSVKIMSTSNDVIYTTADISQTSQSDFNTYFLVNDCNEDIAFDQSHQPDQKYDVVTLKKEEEEEEEGEEEEEEEAEAEEEEEEEEEEEKEEEEEDSLIEHSTVQYMLFEEDQSNSELTFDEIQKILQALEKPRQKELEESVDSKQSNSSKLREGCSVLIHDFLNWFSTKTKLSKTNAMNYTEMSSTQCIEMNSAELCASLAAQTPSENELDDRQQLIDALTDSPTTEKTQPRLKRSRKQQLTSMNREDSEIIIQPASMLTEEELTGKKRDKRRRSRLPQGRIDPGSASKRHKRKKRQKVVEVIDLDVEEEQQKRNVVEITLDDSKDDKYSSDKENEIIMVMDSDDEVGEEQEEEQSSDVTKLSDVMQCEHCSRNFRQRRTLDTHLRICKKSRESTLRLKKRKTKNKPEQKRKQYSCKICQKKFDVVVVLARHVRVEHSQKKKHKWGPSSQKTEDKSLRSREQIEDEEEEANDEQEEQQNEQKRGEESLSGDGETRELSMLDRVKRNRKQTSTSWETKKLSCSDCGRWFPSSALLDAHSLQHGTKKSEKWLRKCHICKKIIKSKLLFLRHMKMHNTQYSSESKTSPILQRKLRARPSTRKIMPVRKRGRPRKF